VNVCACSRHEDDHNSVEGEESCRLCLCRFFLPCADAASFGGVGDSDKRGPRWPRVEGE
jgi:hypothetical protein